MKENRDPFKIFHYTEKQKTETEAGGKVTSLYEKYYGILSC